MKRIIQRLLIILLVINSSGITVLGEDDIKNNENNTGSTADTSDNSRDNNEEEMPFESEKIDNELFRELKIERTIFEEPAESTLIAEQPNNSISMLNYLTVLSQEIVTSKNSRVYLEGIYTSIINDIYLNAIDERTKNRLIDLLFVVKQFRMIDIKRERLNYLYRQNQAQALRAAIPNPLGLLSATQSFSLKKLIASGLYMAVDSITSYNAYKNQLDLQYLKDGWALDDEEMNTVFDLREDAFLYMVDVVNENNLPGEYALNEESVSEFVKRKNDTKNINSRIQFLEDNKEIYSEYGGYWLTLAESYYLNNRYDKCLDAIKTYEKKQGKIYRYDRDLARILPYAIVCIQETEKNKNICEKEILHYLGLLIANSKNSDWALRYFAAQTYVELYSESKNKEYLERAYKLCRSNVNNLIELQMNNNEKYLGDIVEETVSKDATKEEKQEIKSYNKLIKEERKVALPPVSEPLLLNCDLLFELAKLLDISKSEQEWINGILHPAGEPMFLVSPLDQKYWFNSKADNSIDNVSFDKTKIVLPASCISDNYYIAVTVKEGSEEKIYDDWTVSEVKRNKATDPELFEVTLNSKKIKEYKFTDKSIVKVEIVPSLSVDSEKLVAEFKTSQNKQCH